MGDNSGSAGEWRCIAQADNSSRTAAHGRGRRPSHPRNPSPPIPFFAGSAAPLGPVGWPAWSRFNYAG